MRRLFLSLFLAFFLFFPAVQAQEFQIPMDEIVGVIFILIFIFLLLAVADVLPKLRAPTQLFLKIFLLGAIAAAFILPQFIPYPVYLEVPENYKIKPLSKSVSTVFIMLGLPEEWMYIPAIIYLFILPFAGLYAIVWAFLTELQIFTKVSAKVNRLLAFIITFLTIPVGWFVKMVWVLFAFMGAWSIGVFAVTFIIGAFYKGVGKVTEMKEKARWEYQTGKELRRRLEDILNSIKENDLQTAASKIGNLFKDPRFVARQPFLEDLQRFTDVNRLTQNKDDAEKLIEKLIGSLPR